MEIQDKSKNEILVEISTMLRYLADLVEALVEENHITLLEVRSLLAQKSQEGFNNQIRELLKTFGGTKLSEIDKKDYAALMQKLEELQNA